jgi:hypothetical protein
MYNGQTQEMKYKSRKLSRAKANGLLLNSISIN